MKFEWLNTTQIAFGEDSVNEHMKDFVKPHTKVLVTFGGGSIDKNGARDDVTKALSELECEVRWEGGIPANPEFDRLVEIVKVAREYKPDLLLAVGGRSVVDGTKFISLAMNIEDGTDMWDMVKYWKHPSKSTPIGTVMTIPATDSEWNNGAVISRRSTKEKLPLINNLLYLSFSILDPKYTMTLPKRQLRNGLYDAMTHCIDLVITPHVLPMQDNFMYCVMKELVDISGDVMSDDKSTIEVRGRLVQACSFALNYVLQLGKVTCCGIHGIAHMLTAKWGIDHASTLSIITPFFLEEFIESRKYTMARAAEFVFGVRDGDDYTKAKEFIKHIREWIISIGQFTKVTDQPGVVLQAGDVDEVTNMVMDSFNGNNFGYKNTVTRENVHHILERAFNQ